MSGPLTGDIVVAGHICLDLIPEIGVRKSSLAELLVPGKLLAVGPIITSTGGAVANTGLALHKLGLPVRLVGKVGADAFGGVVLGLLAKHGAKLTDYMVVDGASDTSYTVVVSPPGIDRVFLHHPGANNTFSADDVRKAHLHGAALFHLGYPPLMEKLYADDGAELARLFLSVRGAGLMTSLDMAMPDPDSAAGRIDWRAVLRSVLPHVDFFMPSLDEIAYMLLGARATGETLNLPRLREITHWLIGAGAGAVLLKLGDEGAYLRTSGDAGRLPKLGSDWVGRELLTSCYSVHVSGATGAGDCTIAGMLAAIHAGWKPAEALNLAVAVGACSVEAPDATGGVRPLGKTLERIRGGWEKRPCEMSVDECHWDAEAQLWAGAADGTAG